MPTNSLRSILSTSFIAHLFCLFGCVSLFAAALFSLPIFFARLVSVSVRPAVGQNQISDLQPMRRYCYCSISFLSLSHVLLTNAPRSLITESAVASASFLANAGGVDFANAAAVFADSRMLRIIR